LEDPTDLPPTLATPGIRQGRGRPEKMRQDVTFSATLKLDAERKAGEMLEKMPKHKRGRPAKNRRQDVTGFPVSYDELGIDKKYAERWQAEASVPEQHYHAYIADCREIGRIPTSSGLVTLARRSRRQKPSGNVSGRFPKRGRPYFTPSRIAADNRGDADVCEAPFTMMIPGSSDAS
jgi:hypothetical protein